MTDFPHHYAVAASAVAAASKLQWTSLRCAAVGRLDRVDRVIQFTHIRLRVQLGLPPDVSADLAHRALEKAERACLITASLKTATTLEVAIDQAAETTHDEPREYADMLD